MPLFVYFKLMSTFLYISASQSSVVKDVKKFQDFPGGAVVKNPSASAGDMGSSPGPGRFPHVAKQLSPCATTTEPVL